MKLVIDIDENVFTRLFDNGGDDESDIAKVCAAVRGGTPLPEHHGRLIDADAITKDVETLQNSFVINIDNMTGKILGCECLAPTIIERSDTDECNL